jgi:hypothetical protein
MYLEGVHIAATGATQGVLSLGKKIGEKIERERVY